MQWTPAEIKRRRESRGLTQQQLADALALSRRAVNNWETGKREPRGSSLRELERVLGDSPEDDVTLHGASLMQIFADLARRYADLEAEVRTLRAGQREDQPELQPDFYPGMRAALPQHLRSPQTGGLRSNDG